MRTAKLLEMLARAQFDQGRSAEAAETRHGALALLDDEPSKTRAMLLASLTKDLMMESRYHEAVDAAKIALEVAQAAGDEASQIRALDAMGVSLFGLARFDEGERALREALRREEEGGHMHLLQSHLNLAEALAEAGRLTEARELADEGFAKLTERGFPRRWLALMRSELAFEAGDWAEAERLLPSPGRPTMGMTFVNEALRRIELALGRGDHELARTILDQAADVAAESREPQWIGPLGALRAELERRGGDLDAARTAIEDALDRLDFCSQDVARMSRVAAAGVRVEADAAVRARDLGEDPSFAIAMARGADRARERVRRGRAAGRGRVPGERAGRARARRGPRRPGSVDRGGRRLAGARAPVPSGAGAATQGRGPARARRTATLPRRRRRRRSRPRRRSAPRGWRQRSRVSRCVRGCGWSPTSLRRRPRRPPRTPAKTRSGSRRGSVRCWRYWPTGGRTARSGRRCTWPRRRRSVHVSRILSKLDVRSRTEAAAVAHRVGLV